MTPQQARIIVHMSGWQIANIVINKDTKCQKKGIDIPKDTKGYIGLDQSWKLSDNTFGAMINIIKDGKYVEEKVELNREDFNPVSPS